MNTEKRKAPKPTDKNHIEQYQDWQNNMYNPGHFTGGRQPIWLRQPNKRKYLGASFLIFGIIYIGAIFINIFYPLDISDKTDQVLNIIFFGFAAMLLIIIGIKLILSSRKKS